MTDKAHSNTISIDKDKMIDGDKGIAYVWPGAGPREVVYEVWGSGGIQYECESESGAMAVIKYLNGKRDNYLYFLKGFGKLMLGSRAK